MEQDEIQRTLIAAREARQAGRRDDAVRLLERLVEQAGEHPNALNALGLNAIDDARHADAAVWIRRAIAADPAAPELWMNLARAYREQGDDAAEREALEGALAIDQRYFMALVRLAELFERTGEGSLAAMRWGAVVELAAMSEQRTPALEQIADRARERVAHYHAGFATAIDDGLAEARDGVSTAERRRFEACIDHVLGRRAIFANECAGLHYPFLPADEFFERRHFPWLEELEGRTDVIRTELEGLLGSDDAGFLPYVTMEPGTPENKWTRLDGSMEWGALHLWKDGRRNDAACARAPRTAAVVEALPLSDLPGRTPTVFFSLLRPGAHLPAHTGVSNVRAIIHLPLIVPPGCSFRVGGETREWEVGKAWAFDDTIEHEAWNRSDQLRAVLIFDVWNPYLTEAEKTLLRRFYEVANRTDHAGDGAIGIGEG